MNNLDFKPRIAQVRRALREAKAQVFIAGQGPNTRYLTGSIAPAVTLSYVVIPLEGEPLAITSSLEEYRNRRECALKDLRVFSPYPAIGAPSADPEAALKLVLKELKPAKILADTKVDQRPKGVKLEQSSIVEEARQVKEPVELRHIEQAVRIANRGARFIRQVIEEKGESLTERQVANQLDFFLRDQKGAQLNSFETIVGSGPLAAHSHHTNTNRKLKAGDPVICDFGVFVNGYCSDITRTYFVGGSPANRELKEIYSLVLEANLAGIATVKANRACKTVDGACRDLITKHDHGRNFVHGTGHGFGLEVHEMPAVTYNKPERLRSRTTITIEPGIYVKGVGGVRIEDDVVVTPHGCQVLTQAAKDIY